MKYHPIAVQIEDAPVLVVGGGKVAERKAMALVDAGARIRIVSPDITAKLKTLVDKGRVSWRKRYVRKEDLDNAKLVVAATSDKRVNKDVSRWAKKTGTWANVVDDAALSNFISPAIVRKNIALIAVYTDGRDPVLSRDLKNFLKERWDEFISYRNRS